MNTDAKNGVWRMIVAMGLSGTIGLFVVSSGQPPLTVVFFRCLIGSTALLAWLKWRGDWRRMNRRAVGWLAIGAVALIANWLCLFSAYRLSSISIATVVYHFQPFFLIVLVAVTQKEVPGKARLAWMGVAFGGVILTTGIDSGNGLAGNMVHGVALALAAAFLYAIATLATRKLTGTPPAQIAGLQLLMGASVLAPMADFSHDLGRLSSWTSLLVLGLVHTGFMYNLMYAAFQRLSASMIASLSFVYPAVAILVDIVYFQIVPSTLQVFGIVMILTAVVANQCGWNLATVKALLPSQSRSNS